MKLKATTRVFAFIGTVSACMVLLASPVMAWSGATGTKDLDGDGDGDPVGTGSTFGMYLGGNNDQDTMWNTYNTYSSLSKTEWWTSDTQILSWQDYQRNENLVNGGNLTTDQWKAITPAETGFLESEPHYQANHLVDQVSAGDSFWFGVSYEVGIVDYVTRIRESHGNLPTGTEIYLGLSSYGEAAPFMGLDGGSGFTSDNLTALNGGTPLDVSPSGIDIQDGAMAWFQFENTGNGEGKGDAPVFEIKGTLGAISLTEWIYYVEIPADAMGTDANGNPASWSSTATDWLANGDLKGENPPNATNDIIFSWSNDYGDAKKGGPGPGDVTNPNYEYDILEIPEPSTVIYGALVSMIFMLRRRRK